MDFKDYYQVLGVERDASADDIKKAYRRLARKYHPDVSKEADAEARMSEVNEANSVLSDPERRQAYDELGNRHGAGNDFQPPPDWQHSRRRAPPGGGFNGGAGGGFNRGFSGSFNEGFGGARPGGNPFGAGPGAGPGDEDGNYSEFFSSLFGRRAAESAAQAEMRFDGNDHHARIDVSINEAYHGAERTLQLRDSDGSLRTLQVQIPKGVREGQLVRLAGQGMPGFNGGKAGNLYLEIHLLTEPNLRVDGRDVYQRLPVTPWEAALGGPVEANTIGGTVEIGIPRDSQAGRKLRLRGKGMPGKEPGDLYLELAVVLPPADSDAARALYERMASELAFNPRSADQGRKQEAST